MTPPSLEELIYDTAREAITHQASQLSDLRGRVSTVMAAAALTASFLGAAAFTQSAPAWAIALALAGFLLTGALVLAVLWPAEMRFAIDAAEMHQALFSLRENPPAFLLNAAYGLRDAYAANQQLVRRREQAFRGAVLALGAETLLWALALAVS